LHCHAVAVINAGFKSLFFALLLNSTEIPPDSFSLDDYPHITEKMLQLPKFALPEKIPAGAHASRCRTTLKWAWLDC